MEEAPTY